MANTSKIMGCRPLGPVIRANVYKHVTGVAIYRYQLSTLHGSGYADTATYTGSAGQALLGSVIGFQEGDWSPANSTYSGYLPANPASVDANGYVNVLIADSPEQLFLMEEDTGGTALTQSAVGLGCVPTLIGTTGSTISGVSHAVLDRSLSGTAPCTNLNLQLIKLWDKPDNAYGNFAKWVVRIADHQYNRVNFPVANGSVFI